MKISSIGTRIKVQDIKRSRVFYESLGFEPVFAMGSDDFRASMPTTLESVSEDYNGVIYEIQDGSTYEIADGHIGVKNQNVFSEQIVSEKVSAMVRVDSLVDLFSNENLDIVFPVRHYYWGTIEVALRDPDGYVLVFIAPYSDAELDSLKKYVTVESIQPDATK